MKVNKTLYIVEREDWLFGWRRTAFLLALLLVTIFSQVDRILPFILAESIKADLHLTDTQLGLISGLAFSVCYSLASLPLARLADRGWAKPILVWCIVLWSIMTGAGGLATGFLTLALSRFGVALGEAGGTPASHALITAKISEKFRGRAIGLTAMGIPLGTMLGFALGGYAGDTIGWRNALFAAAGLGFVVVMVVLAFVGARVFKTHSPVNNQNLFKAGKALFAKPAFPWLFATAHLLGFASAPFYIFTAPFLIRQHGFTTSEVGLFFGVLQGLMGIAGTILGGRLFDKAVGRSSARIMNPPAFLLLFAALTTCLALFAPTGWMSIALFVPAMLCFAFLLPFAFGTGHLVAGEGKQAFATGLILLGSGLLPAALAPLLTGLISDMATEAGSHNGLQMGLLVTPVFSLLGGIACFIISRKLTVANLQN